MYLCAILIAISDKQTLSQINILDGPLQLFLISV
jgi:hypothetical protein